MRPRLLVLAPVPSSWRAELDARFDLILATTPATRAAMAEPAGPDLSDVRIVLTTGSLGFTAAEMDRMPALGLICAFGAGYENIALDPARARGITVTNGAGTNASGVADHALGLVLALLRRIPQGDRVVRAGGFREALGMPDGLTGRHLGIVGLGAIGRRIALRAAAFEMVVGYTGRAAKDDAPWAFHPSVTALAHWSDVLVVAAPGGAQTRHLISADVLEALGPRGSLVNVARGSLVDTAALARALSQKRIAGAALDVYEGEPDAPTALLGFDTVVLSPHVGGWSPQATDASMRRFVENAQRFLAGQPVLTPVTRSS